MKSVVIFACTVALAMAQRPSFAGSSQKVYPELATRFQDTSSSSSTNSTAGATIVNRIGSVDVPKTTEKLPIDARGDANLVNTLNSWPRENRPYWLINSELIERHRDPQGTRTKDEKKY